MDFLPLKHLPLLNSVLLTAMFLYLSSKARRHTSVFWFAASLLPLTIFQIGTYLFLHSSSQLGPVLIVFGLNLIPLTFPRFGQLLGRESAGRLMPLWRVYYGGQILLLLLLTADLFLGHF